MEEAATNLAREIDREILWSMLEGMGWIRVILPVDSSTMFKSHIKLWLDSNCKNPYETNGRDYLFEEEQDANWFKLRWMS